MKKIIILNGPPECGKDTIGNMLLSLVDCALTSFKHDLYQATANYFEEDLGWLKRVCNDRKAKDLIKFDCLGDRTPREALIFVSEEICKPKHGENFFGLQAANRILQSEKLPEIVVFTDGGFKTEIPPLSIVGEVTIVQLHGRGNFDKDSRSYIDLPNTSTIKINLEEGNPEKAVHEIIDKLGLT